MIKRLSKGSTDTLMAASRGNEIIDFCNALSQLVVYKGSQSDAPSRLIISDGNAVLYLNSSGSDGKAYPWIGDLKDDDGQYFAWFGNSTYVSSEGASPLKAAKFAVFDKNDSNASQFNFSVGDPNSANDAFVLEYGGATVKIGWIDHPEIWLQSSDTTQSTYTAEKIIFEDNAGQHASGVQATHFDVDDKKAFIGFDPNDAEYKVILNSGSVAAGMHPAYLELDNQNIFLGNGDQGRLLEINDGDHACGLHAAYLDFDNSKAFLGYGSDDAEYKLTLQTGGLACGLHAAYLELANQHVFLGYSGSEQTTHLAITSPTAYVKLGPKSEAFLGYGSDSTWHLELPDDSYAKIGQAFLGKGDDGVHLALPGGGCVKIGGDKFTPCGFSMGGITAKILATLDINLDLGELINQAVAAAMAAIQTVLEALKVASELAAENAANWAYYAEDRAMAAEQSAADAAQSAIIAEASMNAATNRATEAATSATNASTSETNANTSAQNASTAEFAAANAQAAAETAASEAEGSALEASQALAQIQMMTWTATCNSDGTITISAS